jgi:hypothetical protein
MSIESQRNISYQIAIQADNDGTHPHESENEEWVYHAFTRSVHLNSESTVLKTIPKFRELPREFRVDFLPSELETTIINPSREAINSSDRIFSILLNSNIRRGNRELIQEHIPTLLQKVNSMVSQDKPIEIVLPTLPFKDQNPLTTRHSLGQTDLGEYLHFVQLRNICASVEAVYNPGIKIHLLTDGLVYADFFGGGKRGQIEQYRINCERIRDHLGLLGKVNIIDMEWLVQNYSHFFQVQKEIKSTLQKAERTNGQMHEAMRSLQRGMFLNIPIPEYDYDDYADLISRPYEEIPDWLQERTYQTAIDYASFLLTMRKVGVLTQTFPEAIRATVHPKNAPQLPIHLVNKHSVTFPYNGVPVVS